MGKEMEMAIRKILEIVKELSENDLGQAIDIFDEKHKEIRENAIKHSHGKVFRIAVLSLQLTSKERKEMYDILLSYTK